MLYSHSRKSSHVYNKMNDEGLGLGLGSCYVHGGSLFINQKLFFLPQQVTFWIATKRKCNTGWWKQKFWINVDVTCICGSCMNTLSSLLWCYKEYDAVGSLVFWYTVVKRDHFVNILRFYMWMYKIHTDSCAQKCHDLYLVAEKETKNKRLCRHLLY